MAKQTAATKRRAEPAAQRSQALDRTTVVLAGTVICGAVMTVLDATAVNVSLAAIRTELHTSLASVQWTLSAYLLCLALVVPVAGWATDRFGAKPVWMLSLAAFTVGSALASVSWSIESLIAFRVLQGLGGGMIAPVAQTILSRAAGPQRMGRVMSMLGTVTVLGPVIGPVLGGFLVAEAGWRWIFYINLPIGLCALAAAAWALPRSGSEGPQRLDVWGLALASSGLAALTFGLSQAGIKTSFARPEVYVPIAVGVALIALFTLHSLRHGRDTVIDVRLFSNRHFAAASVCLFLMGIALFGALLLLPLYYQVARGEGPLAAGLLLVPQGLGVGIAMPIAGRVTDRRGARAAALPGVGLAALGTLAYTQVTAHTPYTLLAVALGVRGLGLGSMMMPVTAAALASLPREALARASSATVVIRQSGGSVGTALVAVILAHKLTAQLGAGGLTGQQSLVRGAHATPLLASAFAQTFWVAFGLIAAVALPAALLPKASRRAR